MSSLYLTCSASRCIDGETRNVGPGCGSSIGHSGTFGICHTQSGSDQFLRLDFASRRIVYRVTVYNRVSTSSAMGRLGQHEVRVGDDPDSPTSNSLCSAKNDSSSVVVHACAQPLSGQYVFVLLPGANRMLNLQEVEVYGSEGASMSCEGSAKACSRKCWSVHWLGCVLSGVQLYGGAHE
jgi:hypothetical protein